jgi:TorA maturation chaperone TorD
MEKVDRIEEQPSPADVMRAGVALADDLMLLARLADREADADLIGALRSAPVATWFSLKLDGAEFNAACNLIEGAFGEMPDPVDAPTLDDLAAEFAAIYLTHHYGASPNESVWRDDEGLERQQAMFAVRAWYARHGVSAPDWRRRADDHLVHELEFLASLLREAGATGALDAAARFLREHPLVWARAFARTVVPRCRLSLYAGAGLLTAIYLDHLAQLLGDALGCDMTPEAIEGRHGSRADSATLTCADQGAFPIQGAGRGW